jgi:hypothetical protein
MLEEGIASPALISDETGRLHAVWRLPDQSTIYHSVWDGASWYQPRTVFNASSVMVSEPKIILTNLGDLLISWADTLPGQLFLIRARADQALVASDWSLPHQSQIILQATDSLAGSWTDLPALQNNTGVVTYTDSSVDNRAARFFRVKP